MSKKSKGSRKVFGTLGASSHTLGDREENDFYATDPCAIDYLFDVEDFSEHIREPACGAGHLSERMIERGKKVMSTDLIDRGYGGVMDFMESDIEFDGDIITNPPYKIADTFAEKAINSVRDGGKVALFLKVLFLEGKKRKKFFKKYPPKKVYVSSSRIKCAKGGRFSEVKSSAVGYAWFVREKGYEGETTVERIN